MPVTGFNRQPNKLVGSHESNLYSGSGSGQLVIGEGPEPVPVPISIPIKKPCVKRI